MDSQVTTRMLSFHLFGNEKLVEVVLELHAQRLAHAQQIAIALDTTGNLVAPILRRLEGAGAVRSLPRTSRRGTLHFEPVTDGVLWPRLLALCQQARQVSERRARR